MIDITTFEPDVPNNTPRISAVVLNRTAAMHIVWCEDGKEKKEYFAIPLDPAFGSLLTTYKGGNENPLLPFTGNPLPVGVEQTRAQDIAEAVYAAIGPIDGNNYRVAAAAVVLRPTGLETAIINRSQRGD